MQSKVTLYSEKDLIEKMKQYAKAHNTSLSKLVDSFFRSLLEENSCEIKTPEKTAKLQGILKTKEFDKKDYQNYLEEKYL